ncbi:MAG: cytochrome-c oxidase, cbb3-type subunit II, partial [Bdellovibrio sp.]
YNGYKTIQASQGLQEQTVMVTNEMAAVKAQKDHGHRWLEGMATIFTVLTLLAILVGSILEIYPTLNLNKYIAGHQITTKPLTPLQLAGRDIYIKEGCYVCHSQMIRKLSFDVKRFGKASTIAESIYDHPFQWGSKRTGPDLARVGGKYPDLWHFKHLLNPRDVIAQSIMPNYPWLAEKNTNFMSLRKKLSVLKMLGVPYSDDEVAQADILAEKEAKEVARRLEEQGVPNATSAYADKEIVALISYLQSLGKQGGGEDAE